ncbi:MAG: hypothetical protein AB1768_05515 [Pseudomonadota bacterium]
MDGAEEVRALMGQPYIFRIGFSEAAVVTDSVRIPELNDSEMDLR